MDATHSYWHPQKADSPLYPDLIWSQPENKNQAGKLLIVGGNAQGFSAPAKAYELSTKAGVGSIKVALPDSLEKSLKSSLEDAVFCPSTPSGSFASRGLAELIDYSGWSDLAMLCGDFGRNSETAILLERFTEEYKGSLSITKDGLDYFTTNPSKLISRPNTLIVGTIAQLQKISIKASPAKPILFSMGLLQLVEALHDLTHEYPIALITMHENNLLTAFNGQVSSTILPKPIERWRVEITSYGSVWWLQNAGKLFEATAIGAASFVQNI
ncbi:MAG TPA: hypothetical protein VGF75_01530 [Candidatus Saccharimonadales bacterium]|jgi:hypothetical protein